MVMICWWWRALQWKWWWWKVSMWYGGFKYFLVFFFGFPGKFFCDILDFHFLTHCRWEPFEFWLNIYIFSHEGVKHWDNPDNKVQGRSVGSISRKVLVSFTQVWKSVNCFIAFNTISITSWFAGGSGKPNVSNVFWTWQSVGTLNALKANFNTLWSRDGWKVSDMIL